jgi:hypothetical protein
MNTQALSYKKYLVILDPLIKQVDTDLYNCISLKLEELGVSISTNTEDYSKSEFQKAIYILNQTRQQSDPYLYDESKKSIVIEFLGANLSLFESTNTDISLEYHLKFKDEKDFLNCYKLLESHLSSVSAVNENRLFQKSELNLKKISQNKILKERVLKSEDLLMIESIEQEIYSATNFTELIEILDNINKANDFSFKINYPFEVSYEEHFLPLKFENQLWFLSYDHELSKNDLLPYVYQTLYAALLRLDSKKTNFEILKNLESIFTEISIPLVIFDKDQQLVLHNELFINLNISAKKCFSLEANDQLTIDNNVFKVQKIYVEEGEHIHMNFIPVNDVLGSSTSPTSEELGIVSSSIAHELNNPLAGILAALTVLEMDEYPDDVMEKFSQMRKSVLRCKKLVETFLGFSKVQGSSFHSTMSLEESFNQAMELIRFRLIENNITIYFEYTTNSKMSSSVNGHVMSMIYYLLLGEVLTNFSHQNLVELKNSQKIEGEAREYADHFELILPENISLAASFFKSKLMSHLLESQKLQIEVSKNKCTLFL